MHNCIDNCPEVAAHLHWKLWPWEPHSSISPHQDPHAVQRCTAKCCIWTIFSAILHLNYIQCNIAYMSNIQCNFVTVGLQCTASKFTSTIQLCIAKRWTKIWKYSRVQNSHVQGSPILAPLAACLMTLFYTWYPTNCNCTYFCFPCLILLSMQAAPSFAHLILHCLLFYLNGGIIFGFYRNLITPLLSWWE